MLARSETQPAHAGDRIHRSVGVFGGEMKERRRGTPVVPAGQRIVRRALLRSAALEKTVIDEIRHRGREVICFYVPKVARNLTRLPPPVEELEDLARDGRNGDALVPRVILNNELTPPPVAN